MTSLSSNLVKITPELARDFLSDKHHYPHNRRVNSSHVTFLAEAMTKGTFDPTSQVAFARFQDKDFLINGQHTLAAIIKSDRPQTLNTIHYVVKTFENIHSLFSHFDIGRSRTFSDSVRAFEVSKGTGLNHMQITKTAGAVRYMKCGFPRGTANKKFHSEDVIDMVYRWSEEALQVFNCTVGGERKVNNRLTAAASLSVLLIIMKYHPDKAKEFISQASKDDGLKTGDPRKALNRYMRDISTSGAAGSGAIKYAYNGQISRSCAKAWNKYISGVQAQTINIRPLDATRNIIIKGTPYTGEFPTGGQSNHV